MTAVLRRLLNLLALLSLVLCISTATLRELSVRAGLDYRHSLPLFADARAAVWSGRLSIYNTDLPYNGGIIGISPGERIETSGFDFPIYFRHFRWATHSVWVVTVPLDVLFILTALLPLGWFLRQVMRHRRKVSGLCHACGYNLTGNRSGVCPECGAAAPSPTP
jgi:hypothetical protein